jgi:SAM-dependent methyltransferase
MSELNLINVGCGISVGRTWKNYDASPTLRFERLPLIGYLYTKNARRFPASVNYGNIVKRPLCPIGTADAVYCSHMLEHVPLEDMRKALGNIYAMLKPDGIFRMIVPDLETRIMRYVKSNERTRAHEFVELTGLGRIQSGSGLVSKFYQVFRTSGHRWMYDWESMNEELSRVQFVAIRRCKFGDSEIKEFAEVEDYRRFEGPLLGPELAIECRKEIAP